MLSSVLEMNCLSVAEQVCSTVALRPCPPPVRSTTAANDASPAAIRPVRTTVIFGRNRRSVDHPFELGGFGGTGLVVGVRWVVRGKDAGSVRIRGYERD